MATRDSYNTNKVQQVLKPLTRTGDATSDEIDMLGFESLLLVANVGTSGDTLSGSLKIEFEVQHSDTSGSNYAACADSDLLNAVTGTNTGCFAVIDASGEDASVYKTGYIGSKRFVKVVANVTGTHTNGTPTSVTAIKGHAHVKPVV